MRRGGPVVALGVTLMVAAGAACFNFSDDLKTCVEAGGPCARDLRPDASTDGGEDSGVAERFTYCSSQVECLSGLCVDGCCDSRCTGVADIAAGTDATCAVVTDGTVRCWGKNVEGGALGERVGDGGHVLVPVPVRAVAGARKVVVGDGFACALISDGTVSCWGLGAAGQLGRGGMDGGPQLPAPVVGLAGALTLAAGENFVCAVVAGGQVRCWGANVQGQLGDGTNTDRIVPVPVCNSGTSEAGCAPLSGAVEVTAAGESACVRVSLGGGRFAARCWGSNSSDQLGPNNPYSRNTPNTVQGLPDALTALHLGPRNGCAVVSKQLWCWGVNRTSNDEWVLLGRGPDAGAATADAGLVCGAFGAAGCEPLNDVVEAGLGIDFGCALVGDAIRCWGSDYLDKLAREVSGNSDRAVPADRGSPELGGVKLLQSKVKELSVGAQHACALLEGGSAVCWGSDVTGQLGNNDARQWNAATGPSRPIW